ncbi:hypothetical protein, partial [Bradyrhizobium sp. F1.13.3]|uniref:hypothetical protein n=1 Tax=Bradyrhizobium sp. F1.13.3 TaxID=3156351 RepID=UPI0033983979
MKGRIVVFLPSKGETMKAVSAHSNRPAWKASQYHSVARRSGWEGAAIWMASQCRGEVMIAAQIVVR